MAVAEREPVTRTMSTAQASRAFPRLVEKVSKREARVVVEEDGNPVAAIISAPDFERFTRSEARRIEWEEVISRMREPFQDISEEQLQHEVAAVVEEVRQGRRP